MYNHKLVLAFFISFSLFLFLNKNDNGQSVLVTIQKDEPLSIVSNRLKKEKVIKSKRLFLIYTVPSAFAQAPQAGKAVAAQAQAAETPPLGYALA
ncbi:MAG TPA: hypothetical protein VLA13_10170, partial [Massilibacterium sp.]|nr:hypothetical protein [Massilibacterium sp.]